MAMMTTGPDGDDNWWWWRQPVKMATTGDGDDDWLLFLWFKKMPIKCHWFPNWYYYL